MGLLRKWISSSAVMKTYEKKNEPAIKDIKSTLLNAEEKKYLQDLQKGVDVSVKVCSVVNPHSCQVPPLKKIFLLVSTEP